MDGERNLRPVSALYLFGLGGGVGFLLDMVGHTIGVFLAGYPVTLSNIYAHGTRALHTESWLVSGGVCCAFGALVVGQIARALLEGQWQTKNK